MSEHGKQGYKVIKLHQIVIMLHCQDVTVVSFMSSDNCFSSDASHMYLAYAKTSFDEVRRNWVIFCYK